MFQTSLSLPYFDSCRLKISIFRIFKTLRSTPNLLADRHVSTSARKPGDYRIGQVFPRDQEDHLHTLVVSVSVFWTMTCFFCEFWTSRKKNETHLSFMSFELYEFKLFGNLEVKKLGYLWMSFPVFQEFLVSSS